MDFININERVQGIIRMSKGVAREYGNGYYAPAHILFALTQKEAGLHPFLESREKDPLYLREWAEVRIEDYAKENTKGDILPDTAVKTLFEEADNVRIKWGLLEINPICLLAAIAKPDAGFSVDELRSFPIKEREIHDLFLSSASTGKKKQANSDKQGEEQNGDYDPLWSAPAGNLEKYCTDKTALAEAGSLHPIV